MSRAIVFRGHNGIVSFGLNDFSLLVLRYSDFDGAVDILVGERSGDADDYFTLGSLTEEEAADFLDRVMEAVEVSGSNDCHNVSINTHAFNTPITELEDDEEGDE